MIVISLKLLLNNTNRRFLLVGGKGGVGKSSISASIATTFANNKQTTLIISTDPAHSLSDSFKQDLTGGEPVPIVGLPNLFAMEIDPKQSSDDFKSLANINKQEDADNLMSQLSQFGLDDLDGIFDTMPPGIDEALALAKVIQFIKSDKYSHFKRIIFDTAPTGHTLRMLSLPDFLDSFMGKIIKLRVKMNNATSMFKSLMGVETQPDNTLEIMEHLKSSMNIVRDLFKDGSQTEFIIATIPTMMAINESERLKSQLYQEGISVNHIIINQIQNDNSNCSFCNVRSKGQSENLKYIQSKFEELTLTTLPFYDKEITGIESLTMMGLDIFS